MRGLFSIIAWYCVMTPCAAAIDKSSSAKDESAVAEAKLKQQYSTFPYPARKREQPAGTNSVDLPTLSYRAFGGRYSSLWRRRDLRILDAGGGTGDSTLTLATQLRDIGNENARLVHLDLSSASQAVTRARAEYQGVLHMISFIRGSFLDQVLMATLGTFDLIVSHGVLHHLMKPVDGLVALKNALRPGGAMCIMVYGKYGRTGIYDVQRMMRLLKYSKEESYHAASPEGQIMSASAFDSEFHEVQALRGLLEALPETSRLRSRGSHFWNAVQGEVRNGSGAYDLFLHSWDRAFTVSDVFNWVERDCGLLINSFNEAGLYDPVLWYKNGERAKNVGKDAKLAKGVSVSRSTHDKEYDDDEYDDEYDDDDDDSNERAQGGTYGRGKDRNRRAADEELLEHIAGLDARSRMALAELMHGALQRHSFYVVEKPFDAPRASSPSLPELPKVTAKAIPCIPRRGQVHWEYELGEQNAEKFTVTMTRRVAYASSVLPRSARVKYEGVNALIQYPWVMGNCQTPFVDIWRKHVRPANPSVTLPMFLEAAESIVSMLGDWGDITILTEPGELLEIGGGEKNGDGAGPQSMDSMFKRGSNAQGKQRRSSSRRRGREL